MTDRPVRTGRPASRPRLASERDYQRTIVGAAKDFGWRVQHTRPAQNGHGHYRTPIQGHIGFPDLVLVHRQVGVFFRELKVSTALTEDQLLWGTALLDAGADWAELRLPDDLDSFCQWLADAPRKAAGIE
jgi:hypothetical protein